MRIVQKAGIAKSEDESAPLTFPVPAYHTGFMARSIICQVVQDPDTPEAARVAVTRLLPEVRSCHDVMRDRKLAMKHAA